MKKGRFSTKKAIMLVVALGVHASVASAEVRQCGVAGASVWWSTSTEWSGNILPKSVNILSGIVRSTWGSCVTATVKYPHKKVAFLRVCNGSNLPFKYTLPLKYIPNEVSVSCKKS